MSPFLKACQLGAHQRHNTRGALKQLKCTRGGEQRCGSLDNGMERNIEVRFVTCLSYLLPPGYTSVHQLGGAQQLI